MTVSAKNPIALTIYLASLIAFAPFSTDIYLASMPMLRQLFHTSTENIQLTLSLFFVSFAVAQLFWGPLSDRIGRKPVVLIGLSVFVIGSLFCALSPSIEFLITARMIQALGACSGVVMAMSMAKDSFTDSVNLSKILSKMTSVAILAPMIAPIIGSYLLVHFNWQANFYFLIGYGSVLFFITLIVQESYPKPIRKPLPMNKLINAYQTQIGYLPFLTIVLAISSNFCVLFSFISASSFVYIQIYHVPTPFFGYLFAFNASALILGGIIFHKVKARFNSKKIVLSSVTLSLCASLLAVITIHIAPQRLGSVAVPIFFVTLGLGVLYPELTAEALKNTVNYTGIASSLIGTCRFIAAAAIGFVMGIIITRSALPLALVMLVLNSMTLICAWVYFKRLFTTSPHSD